MKNHCSGLFKKKEKKDHVTNYGHNKLLGKIFDSFISLTEMAGLIDLIHIVFYVIQSNVYISQIRFFFIRITICSIKK